MPSPATVSMTIGEAQSTETKNLRRSRMPDNKAYSADNVNMLKSTFSVRRMSQEPNRVAQDRADFVREAQDVRHFLRERDKANKRSARCLICQLCSCSLTNPMRCLTRLSWRAGPTDSTLMQFWDTATTLALAYTAVIGPVEARATTSYARLPEAIASDRRTLPSPCVPLPPMIAHSMHAAAQIVFILEENQGSDSALFWIKWIIDIFFIFDSSSPPLPLRAPASSWRMPCGFARGGVGGRVALDAELRF